MTHLDLSDNGLGTEGAIAISTMMKENCYITHLVCSLSLFLSLSLSSLLPSFPPSFSFFCVSINLIQDLSDNAMGPPAAYAIGLMVGSNNTLVSLGLRGTNNITCTEVHKCLLSDH